MLTFLEFTLIDVSSCQQIINPKDRGKSIFNSLQECNSFLLGAFKQAEEE
jgi:hypothetical protein